MRNGLRWTGIGALALWSTACYPKFEETGDPRRRDSGDSRVDTDSSPPDSDSQPPDSDSEDTSARRPVRLQFAGAVMTVTGTPFGMDAESVRTQAATGTMQYDLGVGDDFPLDTGRGVYDHVGGRSAFTLNVAGHTVTGSTHALTELVVTGDSGTWRFKDGPQLGDDTTRTMSVDGVLDLEAELWYSMTRTGGFFPTDAQPDPWVSPNFEGPINTSHTFSVKVTGGEMLLQIDNLDEIVP